MDLTKGILQKQKQHGSPKAGEDVNTELGSPGLGK